MAGTCRNRRNRVKLNRAKNGGVWATGAFYKIVWLFQERAAERRKCRVPAPDKTGENYTQEGGNAELLILKNQGKVIARGGGNPELLLLFVKKQGRVFSREKEIQSSCS